MQNFNQKLGAVMKQYRVWRGLKAKDVAAALGLDAGNFSKYEAGILIANVEMFFHWREAVQMSSRTNPFERVLEIEAGGRNKYRSRVFQLTPSGPPDENNLEL